MNKTSPFFVEKPRNSRISSNYALITFAQYCRSEPTTAAKQNHQDSSKSMEVNVAVKMFSDAVASGASCSTHVVNKNSPNDGRLKNSPAQKTEQH